MIIQKISMGKVLFLLWICITVSGCNRDVMETTIQFEKPSYFPETLYHFDTNPVTKQGFELGRKLFYDPMLSSNNTISCSSCHIQTASFTHAGHSVSHGIFDRLGTRNSPPLVNLAWSSSFMWDGGVFDLDLQPVAPITNHVEMDDSVENVLQRLNADSRYPVLFKSAFGSSEITTANFLKALSQFMVMCVSNNAKYDSVRRGETNFSIEEENGYRLFQLKCSSCHAEPLFTDYSFRNNGLKPSSLNDAGRYTITRNETDKYKFKVPPLRNLSYAAPYMHDGRFFTLDAVLDHYDHQVAASATLDPVLMNNGIPMTTTERSDILAFINTLNDVSFLKDKKFSEQ